MKASKTPAIPATGLRLQWTKKPDGTVIFRALRPDGTATWNRGPVSSPSGFFVSHDLGHYAIETVLNLRNAFWGLLARGWDLLDFETPFPQRNESLRTHDAQLAEYLAGLRDRERQCHMVLTTSEVNEHLQAYFAQNSLGTPRCLTEAELQAIRNRHLVLLEEYDALPVGETLELWFLLEQK